jgi:PAS domain S-box-containing protein
VLWTVRTETPDDEPTYTYISPEVAALLGYAPDELASERHHFRRLVHPDDRARAIAADVASDADPEGIWDLTYRVIRRDGAVRLVHGVGRRATPLGDYPVVWHGMTIDVTHRLERTEHPPTVDATEPGSSPA